MRPSILICRRVFPEVVARRRGHFDVESDDADDVWSRDELIARLQGKAHGFAMPVLSHNRAPLVDEVLAHRL